MKKKQKRKLSHLMFIFSLAMIISSCMTRKVDYNHLNTKDSGSYKNLNKKDQLLYVRKKLMLKGKELRACLDFYNEEDYRVDIILEVENREVKSVSLEKGKLSSKENDCLQNVIKQIKFPLADDIEIKQPLQFYYNSASM